MFEIVMAFTMQFASTSNPTIYNLTHGVGATRANFRDDVFLVQRLMQLANFIIVRDGLPAGSSAQITVDVFFGPETNGMIQAYEENLRREGRLFFVADGMMDSASPDGGVPGEDVTYKIVILNVDAKQTNQNDYNLLPFDSVNPPILRQSLIKGATPPPPPPEPPH